MTAKYVYVATLNGPSFLHYGRFVTAYDASQFDPNNDALTLKPLGPAMSNKDSPLWKTYAIPWDQITCAMQNGGRIYAFFNGDLAYDVTAQPYKVMPTLDYFKFRWAALPTTVARVNFAFVDCQKTVFAHVQDTAYGTMVYALSAGTMMLGAANWARWSLPKLYVGAPEVADSCGSCTSRTNDCSALLISGDDYWIYAVKNVRQAPTLAAKGKIPELMAGAGRQLCGNGSECDVYSCDCCSDNAPCPNSRQTCTNGCGTDQSTCKDGSACNPQKCACCPDKSPCPGAPPTCASCAGGGGKSSFGWSNVILVSIGIIAIVLLLWFYAF
jgi:hypothetical protein